MHQRGDFVSPVSHRTSTQCSRSSVGAASQGQSEEEVFTEDQVQEIERLLSRIGDATDDDQRSEDPPELESVRQVASAHAPPQAVLRGHKDLVGRPRARPVLNERDRVWKARVADAHTYLERKKSDTTKAILNERRFRENNRQLRPRHRTRSPSCTSKPLPSLFDSNTRYDIHADDMVRFVEARGR
ncbi:hypothetical protein NESM_000092100 [Novymonas esmeraldas]|uniref:Uncharacterized protein n=1 Tax=Novymonas esmeraldas TaxID=1808958 RepID=A0AAW0F1C4_9TRYP